MCVHTLGCARVCVCKASVCAHLAVCIWCVCLHAPACVSVCTWCMHECTWGDGGLCTCLAMHLLGRGEDAPESTYVCV